MRPSLSPVHPQGGVTLNILIPDCACAHVRPQSRQTLLVDLASVARRCLALNLVLLRSEHWQDFSDLDNRGRDAAHHRAMLILAFEHGYLGHLTGPVHRYLLDGDQLKPGLTAGYLNSLREHWLDEHDEFERHIKAKGHVGHLVELGIAAQFEMSGWSITNMDAFAPAGVSWPDIEAAHLEQGEFAIEVKNIGAHPDEFRAVVESLNGGSGTFSWSPYEFSDFLMFRAFEAAHQLRGQANRRRGVVLVVSAEAWGCASLPIQENWIRWDFPAFKFVNGTSEAFVKQQAKKAKYKDTFPKWASMVSDLDRIWIFRNRGDFTYELVQEHRPAAVKAARDYLPHPNPPQILKPRRAGPVLYGSNGDVVLRVGQNANSDADDNIGEPDEDGL